MAREDKEQSNKHPCEEEPTLRGSVQFAVGKLQAGIKSKRGGRSKPRCTRLRQVLLFFRLKW